MNAIPSQHDRPLCIQGEIYLTQDLDSFTNAIATVSLEEVSRIDAPSTTIATQVILHVQHQRGMEQRVPFILEVGAIDPRLRYSMRAHISLQGSEQIHVGDYVTVQSYPVQIAGDSQPISIAVRRVQS